MENIFCKHCAFFHPIDNKFHGNCTSKKFVKSTFNAKFVNYGKKTNRHQYAAEPNMVVLENDEGWGIKVGVDFGCIHFIKE